ncbi:hypothetical protein [Fulvivirga lutea]|uniref:Uncharacterized protein n=1 Tax=Fulvivirga lutea TaxID=2810512 RepID=A0A974WF11_9BACT|nr:hypothetical protein [Fulvivirga lutea]QSE97228.1 hypothetical protein JR347_16800 [Fulvivirga lutea]
MKTKYFLSFLIAILTACGSNTQENNEESPDNNSSNTLTESVEKITEKKVEVNKIDSSKIIVYERDYYPEEIEGAWFSDPKENGHFYISDSVFYLHANETFPFWVTHDSLIINWGYDTVGYRITTRNDTLRLVPLNDLTEEGLFRIVD